MTDANTHLLVGAGREVRSVPADAFVESVKGLPARMAARLEFMSHEHHAVRDFVVRELPRDGRPISPTRIAEITGLKRERVAAILAELEKNLFFLVRDSGGNVSWAYPVTASPTPHRLSFSTGEQIFGA